MTQVWLVFLGLAALVACAMFTVALRRRPLIGAVSGAVTILVAWEIPNPPALANVAGTSIYFVDVLSASFLIVALSTLAQLRRNLGLTSWPWLALGLLLVVSLVRGTVENPLGPTMNEFRGFLYPYAALTWAMSLAWTADLVRVIVGKGTLAIGWGLVLVAGYHIAQFGLGSASAFVDAGTGIEQTTRPLVSGQALVLLMCAAVSLWLWRHLSRNSYVFSAIAFGLIVVVVQQRTVWGVTVVAAAAVLLFSAPRTKAAFLVCGALAGILLLFVLTSPIFEAMLAELAVSATNSGTYDARTTSWLNLINQTLLKGPETVIFGAPMGTGFGRLEGIDRWVVFAPHNWYLTLYLRSGLLGLALFISFIGLTFVNALRRRANMAAIAVMIMMMVYGWSYSWLWYTCIIAGWAYSAANTQSDEKLNLTHAELTLGAPRNQEPIWPRARY